MWRSNGPVEDDVSNSAGIDPQTKRRPLRHRALRDALAEQTVVKSLEDVRSYRAFERTLIESASPQPRNSGWLETREKSAKIRPGSQTGPFQSRRRNEAAITGLLADERAQARSPF